MRDDFLSSDWAGNNHRFAIHVRALAAAIMLAFRSGVARQHAAPWRTGHCG